MTKRSSQRILLAAILSGAASVLHADPGYNLASVVVTNSYIAESVKGQGMWTLGAVASGYAVPGYSPVFIETFDNYVAGSFAGQGMPVWSSSVWASLNPMVSSGRDKHLEGDITSQGGTAASCLFPNLFADGNDAGRIEFDFRRGVCELDFLLGPTTNIDGVASISDVESIGGQFAGYGGGCFTPRYHGEYHGPQIVYRPWQPGTTYHLVMDLVKTGTVVSVTTTVDGIPLENLSGIIITNTASQGINSLMIRGADHVLPTYAVDNVKVSVPFKPGSMSQFLR